jgi:hypothetical protein
LVKVGVAQVDLVAQHELPRAARMPSRRALP